MSTDGPDDNPREDQPNQERPDPVGGSAYTSATRAIQTAPVPPLPPPGKGAYPGHDPAVFAMPLGDHLEDLRRRLIIAILGVVPIFVLALVFGRWLLSAIVMPAKEALRAQGLPPMLQATGPLEVFTSYIKLAVVASILVGVPWLLWQGWQFVRPGLYASERRFVYVLAPLSVGLAASAVAFLYWIMLPLVLSFFIGFGASLGLDRVEQGALPEGVVLPSAPILERDPINPAVGEMWINKDLREMRVSFGTDANGNPLVRGMPMTSGAGVSQQFRVSEYVSLVFQLGLAFAIGFQMPVVVLLLGWAGLVSPPMLTKYRREAALGCAALGALLTPADPVSMFALALPLYALFEFGIILLRVLPAERVSAGFPTLGPGNSGGGSGS